MSLGAFGWEVHRSSPASSRLEKDLPGQVLDIGNGLTWNICPSQADFRVREIATCIREQLWGKFRFCISIFTLQRGVSAPLGPDNSKDQLNPSSTAGASKLPQAIRARGCGSKTAHGRKVDREAAGTRFLRIS